jgi:hypothetical protein
MACMAMGVSQPRWLRACASSSEPCLLPLQERLRLVRSRLLAADTRATLTRLGLAEEAMSAARASLAAKVGWGAGGTGRATNHPKHTTSQSSASVPNPLGRKPLDSPIFPD